MAPKSGNKKVAPKKACLRCPDDIDKDVKCGQTIKCKLTTGDYNDPEKLWPKFPSDLNSSLEDKALQNCERLLVAAETRTEYLYEDITRQMLEEALKILQDQDKSKNKAKASGSSTAAGKAQASTSSTAAGKGKAPSLGPFASSSSVTTAGPSSTMGTMTGSEVPHESAAGSAYSSNQNLVIRERQHPELKLGYNSAFNRSVVSPFARPQPSVETRMPNREGLPSGGTGSDKTVAIDCVQSWGFKLRPIKDQRDALKSQKDALGDRVEICALRPDFAGTNSRELVTSNHFVVKLDSQKMLYEFEISGIPDGASKAKKRDLVETMMLNCPVVRDQPLEYATDYKKKIIAWKDLFTWRPKEAEDDMRSVIIPGRANPTGDPTPDTILRINFVRKLNLKDLNESVAGRHIAFANNGVIEALNILISKNVSEAEAQSIEVGTNRYYYKPGWSSLTTGLVAIRGYSASVRPGMGQVLLNVNAVMGAFYEPITVDKMIIKFINPNSRTDTRRAERFLKGVRVRISYNRDISAVAKGKQPVPKNTKPEPVGESLDDERRRTKSIWSIGLPIRDQTFMKDGKKISVLTYIKQAYPHAGELNPNNFCVNLGNDAHPAWFPSECLNILSYQLYKSRLDSSQVAEMIRHACRDPDTNRRLIMGEGLRSIGITERTPEVLERAKISIDPRMIEVPAWSITMPKLICGNRPRNPREDPIAIMDPLASAEHGYHWLMSRRRPLKLEKRYSAETHLIIVSGRSFDNEGQLATFANEFNTKIGAYGFGVSIELTEKNTHRIKTATPPDIATALAEISKHKVGLVVFILPSSGSGDANGYRYFKSQADQVYGFKSICMAGDKIKKGRLDNARQAQEQAYRQGRNYADIKGGMSAYMSGIALKLSLKLGNWNWEISADGLKQYLTTNNGVGSSARLDTLILGADVTHPSAGSSEVCPSVAAVVGSVDWACGVMPGSMRRQTGRVEMIEDLQSMVEERLRDWNATPRRLRASSEHELPARIIYYRDGASESQYSAIKRIEITQIRGVWQKLRAEAIAQNKSSIIPKDVKITTVLVSKRHNTRFYPSKNSPLRDQNKGNLIPGVVIESVVTTPYWHDFYLNSHHGLQGTVRPCHYIVLEDDNAMSAKALQTLTFWLCHLYQRASCSVSYVTPTYYADRLCERGRHYLHEFFDGHADVKGKDEKAVRRMLDEAWSRGDPGRERKNPWHPNLDGTMFWL